MGWLGRFLVVWVILTPVTARAARVKPPRITARAAILVEARSGRVLWARNPDLKLAPASTTKVMTALLGLESKRLREPLATSRRAARVAPTKLRLRPGQRLRLEDLVYAILLNSANDAAVVIAEGLAGSVGRFASRMNKRAKELGARNTHFVNPHGLPQAGHYSTVRDLAKIFRHALLNRKFRQIVGTEKRAIKAVGSRRVIRLRSHNRLLNATGTPAVGKTGYTKRAKRCFVGAGKRGEVEVIVAVLGSTDLWSDTRKLLRFAYAQVSGERSKVVQAVRPVGAGSRVGRKLAPLNGHRGYGIRLSAATDMARARRLQHAVSRRGFDAFIREVSASRGVSKYQVFVGLFFSRGEARNALRKLSGEVSLPAEIVVARRDWPS